MRQTIAPTVKAIARQTRVVIMGMFPNSYEGWYIFFQFTSLILVLLTFAAAGGTFFTGRVINERQAKGIANAQLEAARANERAEVLAKQNLELQNRVEQEKREREEFEKSSEPRILPYSSDDTFLESFAGTEVVFEVVSQDEPVQFARQIGFSLTQSKWKVLEYIPSKGTVPGVTIVVKRHINTDINGMLMPSPLLSKPQADALATLLKKYGFEANVFGTYTDWPKNVPETAVLVKIGPKNNRRLIIRQAEEQIERTTDPVLKEILKESLKAMKDHIKP